MSFEELLDSPAPPLGALSGDTTESIVSRLGALGIELNRDQLRAQARRAGSPSALAQRWMDERPDLGGRVITGAGEIRTLVPGELPLDLEVFLTEAAFELWRRWLSDLTCAEILADEFDREYEPLDVLMFGNPLALREAVNRAWRIIHAVAPAGRPVDGDLFTGIWEHCYHDLALWLRCLPQILAHRDQFGEAIHLCERLAPIFDARAFLADRALLLAQAGRLEEAGKQVSANVRAWPKDAMVLKKSCETLWSLGHAEEALLLYDEVLEILSRRRTREERMPCPRLIEM